MKITIKEKEYNIRYTLRALFIYEQITGRAFKIQNITDEYIFIYSLILANVPDIEMSFEDFVNECDDNPDMIISMQNFLIKEMEKQSVFTPSNEESKKKN